MAEEESTGDEMEEQPVNNGQRGKKPCNRRIDELSKPTKRLLLGSFKDHGHLFPKEKSNRLKEILAIMYAMTPEETEKYFAQLRAEAQVIAGKKKMKDKLKKLVAGKKRKEMRRRAYILFKNIIKVGLMHAATHDVPPLVSIRLRNLSDLILQQICDLRGVPIPDRLEIKSRQDKFLISAADWIAIAVENIYYSVQLRKNDELLEIENAERQQKEDEEMRKDFEKGKPGFTSTPTGSITGEGSITDEK